MKKDKTDYSDFDRLVSKLSSEPGILQMKGFMQHGRITTYEHVMNVALTSFLINRRLRLKGKEDELVRGAILHDYFLYDWHHWEGELHGFYHAGAALRNARRDFALTPREENIIGSHMWPLNLTKIPRCREAWIVCIADKIVSAKETLFLR